MIFRYILLTFIFTFCVHATTSEKMSAKWKLLFHLNTKELKIIKKVKRKDVSLFHRMLVLYTERLFLIKELENKEYLSGKISKNKAFVKSESLYRKSMKVGGVILKSFPRYPEIAEVIYTLGLNEQEFKKNVSAEKLFKKALKLSKNNELTSKIKVTLAEHFYNLKKFKEAVSLYKDITINIKDEWLTKHLYNLAWCQLKLKDYPNAITNLKESMSLSKTGYVDYSEQVLNSTPIFFVFSNQVKDGVNFINTYSENKLNDLISLADAAKQRSNYSDSLYTLKIGEQYAVTNDNKVSLSFEKIKLYKQFGKNEDHLTETRNLLKLDHNGKKGNEDIVEHIRGHVGLKQSLLANGANSDPKKLLNEIDFYFNGLKEIDSKNKYLYLFYQAESYYSVKKYEKSLDLYISSYRNIKKNKNKLGNELMPKIFKSMLSILDEGDFTKISLFKYSKYIYSNYLLEWPKGTISKKIYSKLFFAYIDNKNTLKSIKLLKIYNKNYPGNLSSQQEMYKTSINQLINARNTKGLAYAIVDMKNGLFKVDNKTIKNTEISLGTILFKEFNLLENSGENKRAIKGYLSLYNNKLYPPNIKLKTSKFILNLYLKEMDVQNSKKWFLNTLVLSDRKENKNLEVYLNNFINIAEIENGHKISYELLNKYIHSRCKDKVDKKFLSMLIDHSILSFDFSNVYSDISNHSKCLRSVSYSEINKQVFGYIELAPNKYKLKKFATFVKNNSSTLNGHHVNTFLMVYPLDEMEQYADIINIKDKTTLLRNIENFIELNKVEGPNIRFSNFNENTFGNELSKNLSIVSVFEKNVLSLVKGDNYQIKSLSEKKILKLYNDFYLQLLEVKPDTDDAEFIKSFNTALVPIFAKIKKTISQYEENIRLYSYFSLELEDINRVSYTIDKVQ